MRILMINTASSTIVNFRKDLIISLQEKGHKIVLITADSEFEKEISQLGVTRHTVNVSNRSKNPFNNLLYIFKIRKVVKFEQPEMVLTFQTKPNVLGVFATKKYCTNIFAMIEGLGDVFVKQEIKWKLIRLVVKSMYKISLRYTRKVFFLNTDDMGYFVSNNMVSRSQVILINGIGVNIDRFSFSGISDFSTFIMVSRLLKSKGVIEYCNAAKIVRDKGYNYRFLLVGGESELSKKDISKYIDSKIIDYLGFQNNIKELVTMSTVFVLPSYREGLPMSTLEAMAIGRPIITTNAVGCKETIIDNYNGLQVRVKDEEDLANRMVEIMENNDKIIQFGKNSRKMVEEKFDQRTINKIIIDTLFRE